MTAVRRAAAHNQALGPLYALSSTVGRTQALMRPGPDDQDPPSWYDLPSDRRIVLILTGEQNEKMAGYLAEIRRTPPERRGQPEKWALVGAAIAATTAVAPPPPPACPDCPGTPLWVWSTLAGLALACLALLLFMMWRRGWRQPFGPCAAVAPAAASTMDADATMNASLLAHRSSSVGTAASVRSLSVDQSA